MLSRNEVDQSEEIQNAIDFMFQDFDLDGDGKLVRRKKDTIYYDSISLTLLISYCCV